MMTSMAARLSSFDVNVEFATASSLPTSAGYDLVHVASLLYSPGIVAKVCDWASARHLPVVLSPLHENRLNLWYHEASEWHPTWRTVRRLIGNQSAERFYSSFHNLKLHLANNYDQQRAILQQSYVVTNTTVESQQLRSWFRLPDLPTATVPLGIDDAHFDPDAIKPSPALPCSPGYVLQVSRIQAEKNQAMLLQALFDVPCDIILAGSGVPNQPEYLQRCQELARARGRAWFLGEVPYDLLPQLYARAGAHVLASWVEHPGLVTLEAAAMGCSVVSTEYSTIGDYLPGMVEWCAPDDPASIRLAVERARSTTQDKRALSAAARRFTWKEAASKMKRVYDTVLLAHRNGKKHTWSAGLASGVGQDPSRPESKTTS